MGKKIGIVTINDDNNYGNRLQNYAVQETLEKMGMNSITLKNIPALNTKNKFWIRKLKYNFNRIFKTNKNNSKRHECFVEFNKNIKFSENNITPFSKIRNEFDFFITGSDQVWNPTILRMREVDLLTFANPNQKIAFSASFGISNLPNEFNKYLKDNLESFKAISVREDVGKQIVESVTNKKNIKVLIDPTMLLTSEDWEKVAKKPEQLKTDKYILNYFLGNLSDSRKEEIDRIAKENNCEIINILDKNGPFYHTGPSEFLYLEKNAFLICTDSFHSSIFAILFKRPFIVFNKEDKMTNMNSRIETLLKKFKLENQLFNNKIAEENLNIDYTNTYKILEEEKRKSIDFLSDSLK